MAVVKEKTIVTQRIHANCPTHSRTEVSTRDVSRPANRPKCSDDTHFGAHCHFRTFVIIR
jgi:hypothetical protein